MKIVILQKGRESGLIVSGEGMPSPEDATPLPGETAPARRQLPLQYMSDFSIVGLAVADLGGAVAVLRQGGYRVETGPCGGEVTVARREALPELCGLLTERGLGCDLTDLVTEIYQG